MSDRGNEFSGDARNTDATDQPFDAVITAKELSGGTWWYQWDELETDVNGELVAMDNARHGTYDPTGPTGVGPAVELNNLEVDVGTKVRLTLRSMVNGDLFYFFASSVQGALGTGTVTNIDATAPTEGFTITGVPITTAGTMVFTLSHDLAALEALSGTNNIYYRSGVSAWSTVTIGDALLFAGGAIAVDLVDATSTTETLVTDATLSMVAGSLRLTRTRVTYTNYFNADGLLIDRTAGSPTFATTDIAACLFEQCCDAAALSVVAGATPTTGTAPLTTALTATPTGGVGPYTYSWDFDDGTPDSATEDPSHEYEEDGTYEAVVIVTDACGRTATDSIVIGVGACPCPSMPTAPPMTGLVCWLKPDSLTAGALATWADSSGIGNDATQATAGDRPTVIAAELNGFPVVRFASGDYLQMDAGWPPQPLTVLVVVKVTGALPTPAQYFIGSDFAGMTLRRDATTPATFQFYNGVSGIGSSGGALTDQWHVLSAWTDDAIATIKYFDGNCTGGSVGAGTGFITTAGAYIGRGPGGSDYLVGDIAEVLVYDEQLSDADYEEARCYLTIKYNL